MELILPILLILPIPIALFIERSPFDATFGETGDELSL